MTGLCSAFQFFPSDLYYLLIILSPASLPLPPTDRNLVWTIRRWNPILWASQWRRPLYVMEAANPRLSSSKKHPCWSTWRRLRTRSLKHSASPTSPNAQLWTWSSLIFPTPSRRDHAGEGEVTNNLCSSHVTLLESVCILTSSLQTSMVWIVLKKTLCTTVPIECKVIFTTYPAMQWWCDNDNDINERTWSYTC